MTAYPAPPVPDPYAPTGYPMPTPTAQPVIPGPTYSGAGSIPGTATIAAILSLVGALWYGIDVIRGWEAIGGLLSSVGQLSSLGMDPSVTAWAYGSAASVVAQLILVPALLIGGVLLLCRISAGRAMVMFGSVLVLATNIFWAIAAFQAVGWMTNFANSVGMSRAVSGELVGMVLLNTGLPALIAVVTLILASASTTKLWCQRSTSSTY
ncbi:hypothetical protein ABQE93_08910 [Mycolicibacterium sp. XJ662]